MNINTNISQIEGLKNQITKAFKIMDRLSPSDSCDGPWEEAFWQLQKAEEAIRGMQAGLEDFVYEAKNLQEALGEIGDVVAQKIESPYREFDFVSYKNNGGQNNAYAKAA